MRFLIGLIKWIRASLLFKKKRKKKAVDMYDTNTKRLPMSCALMYQSTVTDDVCVYVDNKLGHPSPL